MKYDDWFGIEFFNLTVKVRFFEAVPPAVAWVVGQKLSLDELCVEFRYLCSEGLTIDDLYRIAVEFSFTHNLKECVFIAVSRANKRR